MLKVEDIQQNWISYFSDNVPALKIVSKWQWISNSEQGNGGKYWVRKEGGVTKNWVLRDEIERNDYWVRSNITGNNHQI